MLDNLYAHREGDLLVNEQMKVWINERANDRGIAKHPYQAFIVAPIYKRASVVGSLKNSAARRNARPGRIQP